MPDPRSASTGPASGRTSEQQAEERSTPRRATRADEPRHPGVDAARGRTQGTWGRRAPLVLLGVGLGALVDGIVLHQILQWHHMVSAHQEFLPSTVAGLQVNTLADGLFHAAAWLGVAVGLALLLRRWRSGVPAPPVAEQVGLLLIGWGAFNVVEGLVNHHLLGVHHVRDDIGAPVAWDVGFLVVSAALIALGAALVARGARRERHSGPARRRSHSRAVR